MAVLLAILGASWVQAPRCCYNLPVMARWHCGRASVVNGAGSGRLLASQEIEFQVTWKQMHKNLHISTGLYNACLSYSRSNNSLGWIIHLFQLTSLLFIVSFYRIFHRCVYIWRYLEYLEVLLLISQTQENAQDWAWLSQALVPIAASEGPPFADLCRGNAKLREAHNWFGGPKTNQKQQSMWKVVPFYHYKDDLTIIWGTNFF